MVRDLGVHSPPFAGTVTTTQDDIKKHFGNRNRDLETAKQALDKALVGKHGDASIMLGTLAKADSDKVKEILRIRLNIHLP